MLSGDAPLAMIILRFLDFSQGEIDMCGFLLGRNAHMLHFWRGETRMCRISPGENERVRPQHDAGYAPHTL